MRGGLYPIANVAHLGGLVLLVGSIGILDLRIMGFGRRIPLPALSQMLTPLAVAGLLLAVGTGLLMFAADATPMVASRVFQLKILLIVVALLNVVLFRQWLGRSLDREPSMLARLSALTSLGLWLTVGALGRLIAYN